MVRAWSMNVALYLTVFFLGASPVCSICSTSSRRLANPMKRVMRNAMSTIQWLSSMPAASPPANMRSTKPKATMHTSMMAYCLSFTQ